MADELTADEIAAHFSAMDDSVTLINATVADDSEEIAMHGSAAEVKLMVTRNTDHLELQATHSWYSDSSKSKTPYTNAVTAGKTYVG
jgi:ribonucleotide reductase alpha subunit|tara:strand:+ start:265 stop:525 length:261 start_codon:yes stop_codon:yes gene_type:complete